MKTRSYYKDNFKNYLVEFGEVGYVEQIMPPLVHLSGLPGVRNEELVVFENGDTGYVTMLSDSVVEVLLINTNSVPVGTQVTRTGQKLTVKVGEELLGASMSPLGLSLHKSVPLSPVENFKEIHIAPPGIQSRKKISRPLETGVSVVDLLIPLGKGQRELLVGDRKTGKTQFALQTMLSQYRTGSICIYAGIGRETTSVKKVEQYMKDHNMLDRSMIVASSASDPLGTIFITPYVAMTVAEYFKEQGLDVLLVLDDLTTHANYYREISLLGKKFPGRNSYPADIFYSHSRLLERAGNFDISGKDVSISCLPIVNTVGGDLSGYIQTNIMSITDGHLYFDSEWFADGVRPSINYFLSVTRVGRQTQSTVRWGINRELNSFLALLQKTESFVHFGAELNEGVKATIAMGAKLKSFFNQPMHRVLPLDLQILIYCVIWLGTWNSKPEAYVNSMVEIMHKKYESELSYRETLSRMLENASDFNMLLGAVGSNLAKLINQDVEVVGEELGDPSVVREGESVEE